MRYLIFLLIGLLICGCTEQPKANIQTAGAVRPTELESIIRRNTPEITIFGYWIYFQLYDHSNNPLRIENVLVEIMVADAYKDPPYPNEPLMDLWSGKQPTSETGYGHVGDWRPKKQREAHVFVRKTDEDGRVRIPIFIEKEPYPDETYPPWKDGQFLTGVHIVARVRQRGTQYIYGGAVWAFATGKDFLENPPYPFDADNWDTGWNNRLKDVDPSNNNGDGNENYEYNSIVFMNVELDLTDHCFGCNYEWIDRDGDMLSDCYDLCPEDPEKKSPGICGCGLNDFSDVDFDGTIDCLDACPTNSWGTTLPCPVWGDEDLDKDVDMKDFAALQRCLNNNSIECQKWDVNNDNIINNQEINAFISCSAGPSVPSPCIDGPIH